MTLGFILGLLCLILVVVCEFGWLGGEGASGGVAHLKFSLLSSEWGFMLHNSLRISFMNFHGFIILKRCFDEVLYY